ncbi:MAG: ParA family protein [Rickettsiales bacterium]|jgi:chromosome partitioning protein|nr:ParA family protein [Rickettsiales bacterium]
MTIIFSIVNQKGGVGKTTTAINLAAVFAALKKKVLLIDLDPQGNASSSFNVNTDNGSIYRVISNEQSIQEAIVKTKFSSLDIIPCDTNLASAELELSSLENRENVLKEKIKPIANGYDFILIDCPPSLGLLTINSLVASNKVLIPLQCEFFALDGLAHLLETADRIRANFNAQLEVDGVVLTMYDKKSIQTKEIEADIRNFLGDKVYQTTIPRNIKLSEATSHGIPAIVYDTNCAGSEAYLRFGEEVIKKIWK